MPKKKPDSNDVLAACEYARTVISVTPDGADVDYRGLFDTMFGVVEAWVATLDLDIEDGG